jgi:ribosomal-protein-alanine N-acetyltransferase
MAILTTPRLLIREFVENDLADVLEYEVDPEVVHYVAYRPSTAEECRQMLVVFLEEQRKIERNYYQHAIVLKEIQKVIGWCGLEITNREAREVEIGYALNRHYWSRGYMTEAAQVMLAYSFIELQAHRIFGTCDIENEASAYVLRKLGMSYEGHMRSCRWYKGKWHDRLLFSILEDEWRQIQV